MKNLDRFIYWIEEREAIRLRRLRGLPRPWTKDPILNKYRFCNVRRRQDRVSQWVVRNILCDADGMAVVPFLMAVSFARWINWPPTISHVIDRTSLYDPSEKNWRKIAHLLNERALADEKVFTGAYMINGVGCKEGQSKANYVVMDVIHANFKQEGMALRSALRKNNVQAFVEVCQRLNGWGTFMAGQIAADLSYTHHLRNADDLYTWAPRGPGSKRGFNRVYGLPKRSPITNFDWAEGIRDLRAKVADRVEFGHRLTAHDVQNCLCEFDKWCRVYYGEGKPRSTYRPETAF